MRRCSYFFDLFSYPLVHTALLRETGVERQDNFLRIFCWDFLLEIGYNFTRQKIGKVIEGKIGHTHFKENLVMQGKCKHNCCWHWMKLKLKVIFQEVIELFCLLYSDSVRSAVKLMQELSPGLLKCLIAFNW